MLNAANNVSPAPLTRGVNESNLPLVTFAVFAYNQEKYIKEAVESAFAQNYSPLEIIISDDGSSDKTFEIINSLVRNYRGLHHVRAVQTKSNEGIMSHVLSVVAQSNGALIIVAAGDDISYPNRAQTLFDSWGRSGAWALFSKFDRINQNGSMFASDCKLESPNHTIRRCFRDKSEIQLIHGATSAYDRRVFSLLNHNCKGILTEDGVMSFLLYCYGKDVNFVDESLVKYRSHPDALSNAVSKRFNIVRSELRNDEEKAKKYAVAFVNLNTFFLKILEDLKVSRPILIDKILKSEIENQIKYNLMVAGWVDAGFIGRLQFLLSSCRLDGIKWILPRLFGLSFFIRVKVFLNKFRRYLKLS